MKDLKVVLKQSQKIFFRSLVMILVIFLENTTTQLVMIYQDHNSENHYHFKWSVFII